MGKSDLRDPRETVTTSSLLSLCKSRSLSVSLNMSLTRNEVDDRNVSRPSEKSTKLTRELLQSCMRETEISMSQLKLFRFSLLSNENSNGKAGMAMATGNGDEDVKNENNNNNNIADIDYGAAAQLPYLELRRNEPLQCFVRCLYEGVGLVHYDMMLEDAFKLEMQQSLQQHEKSELKECSNIKSKNRCEAAYKLHLCYNYLKNLEAEQHLREVLERSDPDGDTIVPDDDENTDDLSESDKANEVGDRLSELVKAKN